MSLSASCRAIEPAVDNCAWIEKVTPVSPVVVESDKWVEYQTAIAINLEVIENPVSTPRAIEIAIGNIRILTGESRDILTKKTARQIRDHNAAVKRFCEEKVQ